PSDAATEAPLAIYVADMTPLDNVLIPNSAFIAGLPERTAAERVLALLNRSPVDVPGKLAGAPRFPGTETDIFNVPARNSRFTGRESHLWRLRSLLQAGATATVALLSRQTTGQQGMPVALQGM